MTISKSTAWKIAAGLVSIFLLWQGYSITKSMWIDWALNQAKAKHQAEIAEFMEDVLNSHAVNGGVCVINRSGSPWSQCLDDAAVGDNATAALVDHSVKFRLQ